MNQVNFAIVRAERASQRLRPATLTYTVSASSDGPGGPVAIPCSLGNHDFFQRMVLTNAGFQRLEACFVKIIRSDIPQSLHDLPKSFYRGKHVTITNLDPDSPGCNESFDLVIAEQNSHQPMLLLLHLEKELA